MPRLWIAFVPFAFASVVHVWALAIDAHDAARPTKLMLMPFLALAVVWSGHRHWTPAHSLLLTAIGFSWIGDGAGPLFPGVDFVPLMVLFFALAHVCYIWLFWRVLPERRVPLWTVIYGVWWAALLAVLWADLGALLIPVALYGLLLAGTAIGAARCHRLIRWGGAFFVVADTVVAFELFMPGVLPAWSSPLAMATYCLSQGLLAAGVVLSAPERVRAMAQATAETRTGETHAVPSRAVA
ncbi:lysoplasmalogenase [Microbacterium sp. NPDC057407]|uniref:lysoplasmalogenase n=1 Tax=Microbacterium sp. NPDC057407 TaxID=3346120 RepID=UPI00367277F1